MRVIIFCGLFFFSLLLDSFAITLKCKAYIKKFLCLHEHIQNLKCKENFKI